MKAFILSLVGIAFGRDFSIAGISSGGFMTAQMHFAYSKDVLASGVVVGGAYYCASGKEENVGYCTTYPDEIDKNQIFAYIQAQEEAGTIDPTSNLEDSKVYIFAGELDDVVLSAGVRLGYEVFNKYVDEDNIEYVLFEGAAHVWPADGFGGTLRRWRGYR